MIKNKNNNNENKMAWETSVATMSANGKNSYPFC